LLLHLQPECLLHGDKHLEVRAPDRAPVLGSPARPGKRGVNRVSAGRPVRDRAALLVSRREIDPLNPDPRAQGRVPDRPARVPGVPEPLVREVQPAAVAAIQARVARRAPRVNPRKRRKAITARTAPMEVMVKPEVVQARALVTGSNKNAPDSKCRGTSFARHCFLGRGGLAVSTGADECSRCRGSIDVGSIEESQT